MNVNVSNLADDAIDGVRVRLLSPNADERGRLTEIHRNRWQHAPAPLQWDYVETNANFLRGVHVHRLRFDTIVTVRGQGALGLFDLRRNMPSFRQSMLIPVSGDAPMAVLIPPGVGHGFHGLTPSSYLYGLSGYWDGNDQMGCRYDDPALKLDWRVPAPTLCQRDAELPGLETLLRDFEAAGGVAPELQSPAFA